MGTKTQNLLFTAACVAWLLSSVTANAQQQEKPNLLLMDFVAARGADPELARVLQELFAARLQEMNHYQVISSSDVARMLDVEQQRQILGCDQNNCLADIGGALGARWMVTGGLTLLGGRHVLTLKLLDTEQARLDNQLAEQLPADDSQLAESMRVATYTLFKLPVPVLEQPTPWYKNPWVLGIAAGVVLVGGGTAAYFATRPDDEGSAPLGRAVLDAP